jgi:alanine racemase
MPNRPCWVEISTRALEDNYRFLRAACDAGGLAGDMAVELLAIVKADAYGHGLGICAPVVVRAGARWLGVTSVEEGVAARALCPEAEILVISGPFRGQGAAVLAHRLTPVVWEDWQLDELEIAALTAGAAEQTVSVHLELDTGMSRQGVSAKDLDAVLERFEASSPLRLDGLMTHLYAADEADGTISHEQFDRLEPMVARIFDAGLRPKLLHAGNSAALLSGEGPKLLNELCGRYGLRAMLRPGLALYGLAPKFTPEEPAQVTALRAGLQPVLSWKTRIVSIHSLAPGDVVGYNGTFVASEPMRIALLAVGYADGLRRELSNRGSVLIPIQLHGQLEGQPAPIVGRISMDQTVVDITEIPAAEIGDEVLLIGRQGDAVISAEEHALWAGTIPWEILTAISARVERIKL